MNRSFRIAASMSLTALLMAASGAQAQNVKRGALTISHAHARATSAGQATGAAYLTVHNRGDAADRLLSASSTVAARVELHTMTMDGTVMRMREVDAIDLPAGQAVELKPGGLHIMLIGLKAPLAAGSSVPLKLKFENAGELAVNVKVGVVAGAAAASAAHQH